MSLEKIVKKYKQARNITDDYKLDEDEMYFVNEILELEQQLNLLNIGGVNGLLPSQKEQLEVEAYEAAIKLGKEINNEKYIDINSFTLGAIWILEKRQLPLTTV